MNKFSMMPIAVVLSSVLTAPPSFAQPIAPAAAGQAHLIWYKLYLTKKQL
ncbi:hypothetical protein [Laspinema olomoucense]|uniref:Uncharacterized protein n=1 Tax=Laspinema olomoucense D3b TaxID=2953688 RepID=A0ABT2N8T8_9CYAN|nr:hypothetical protein [Laspinema sp. D3b]MCT7978269.1 hypothetical protein [Laspinema sp. D3b]